MAKMLDDYSLSNIFTIVDFGNMILIVPRQTILFNNGNKGVTISSENFKFKVQNENEECQYSSTHFSFAS